MIGYIIAGSAAVVLLLTKIIYDITSKKKCSGKTEGTLIFVDERSDKDTTARQYTYYYVPLYEYTVDGKVYHAETDQFSRNKGAFKVNVKYDVRYNPQKPYKCFINGKKGKPVKESIF